MNQPSPRRRFCRKLACLLVAVPGLGISQGSTKVRSVGYLDVGEDPWEKQIWEALSKLGWVEGKNLRVERRYASSIEGLQPLAEELVRTKVEVIVAGGPNQTLAAMKATSTTPIVFRRSFDPVLFGLVPNLARPGGNVTGFSVEGIELSGKGVSLLKELIPGLKRIGVVETVVCAHAQAV